MIVVIPGAYGGDAGISGGVYSAESGANTITNIGITAYITDNAKNHVDISVLVKNAISTTEGGTVPRFELKTPSVTVPVNGPITESIPADSPAFFKYTLDTGTATAELIQCSQSASHVDESGNVITTLPQASSSIKIEGEGTLKNYIGAAKAYQVKDSTSGAVTGYWAGSGQRFDSASGGTINVDEHANNGISVADLNINVDTGTITGTPGYTSFSLDNSFWNTAYKTTTTQMTLQQPTFNSLTGHQIELTTELSSGDISASSTTSVTEGTVKDRKGNTIYTIPAAIYGGQLTNFAGTVSSSTPMYLGGATFETIEEDIDFDSSATDSNGNTVSASTDLIGTLSGTVMVNIAGVFSMEMEDEDNDNALTYHDVLLAEQMADGDLTGSYLQLYGAVTPAIGRSVSKSKTVINPSVVIPAINTKNIVAFDNVAFYDATTGTSKITQVYNGQVKSPLPF